MRHVAYDQINAGNAYEACISELPNEQSRIDLLAIVDEVKNAAIDYVEKASRGCLYEIENDIEPIMRGKLINLYEEGMRNSRGDGRRIYDKIRALSNNESCPFCSERAIESVDHILPKSDFPIFSVIPDNLVAVCKECNKLKGNFAPISQFEGVIHPYFENVENCRWLHAKVNEQYMAVVDFWVEPVSDWSEAINQRIAKQFRMLKLEDLYGRVAGLELINIRSNLSKQFEIGGAELVKCFLLGEWQRHQHIRLNSWKTACYRALKNSNWYCNRGFQIDGNGPSSCCDLENASSG